MRIQENGIFSPLGKETKQWGIRGEETGDAVSVLHEYDILPQIMRFFEEDFFCCVDNHLLVQDLYSMFFFER